MDREEADQAIQDLAADGQTRQQIAQTLIDDGVPRATAYRWIKEQLPEPVKPSKVQDVLSSVWSLYEEACQAADADAIAKFGSLYISLEAKARKM